MSDLSQPPPPSAPPPNTTTVIWDTESAVGSSDLGESAGGETCPCGGGRLVNGLCHGLTDGNGLSGVGRGESAGSETCPMRGRVGVRRGESAGGETCPCGGGNPLCPSDISPKYDSDNLGCGVRGWIVGFGGDLARRLVHAGEAWVGRGEPAGDETCPCGGG